MIDDGQLPILLNLAQSALKLAERTIKRNLRLFIRLGN